MAPPWVLPSKWFYTPQSGLDKEPETVQNHNWGLQGSPGSLLWLLGGSQGPWGSPAVVVDSFSFPSLEQLVQIDFSSTYKLGFVTVSPAWTSKKDGLEQAFKTT